MMEFRVEDMKFFYFVEKRPKLMPVVYRTRTRRFCVYLKFTKLSLE